MTLARVPADCLQSRVTAFAGREYVKYEFRRVPDDGQAELARLIAVGLLEGEPGVVVVPDVIPAAVGPDATPAAVALADEYGMDLSEIFGTGAGGRVTVWDVKALLTEEEE